MKTWRKAVSLGSAKVQSPTVNQNLLSYWQLWPSFLYYRKKKKKLFYSYVLEPVGYFL